MTDDYPVYAKLSAQKLSQLVELDDDYDPTDDYDDEYNSTSDKPKYCPRCEKYSVEGDTKKLQNPYPRGCLPWATWIMQGLGGWSGYTSGRPPGMPTLVHGLRQFESIFLGWKLALGGLVYTR